LKTKFLDSRVNVHILASISVPFTLATVQVPNLELSQAKRITVWTCTEADTASTLIKKKTQFSSYIKIQKGKSFMANGLLLYD
jgi:hypothetical protein